MSAAYPKRASAVSSESLRAVICQAAIESREDRVSGAWSKAEAEALAEGAG
jgi:hypothetical protein